MTQINELLFGDPAVSLRTTSEALIRHIARVEVALARTQGRIGMFPKRGADSIGAIDITALNTDQIIQESARSGFPVIPLLGEIRKQLDPETAQFLHWGATTQDVIDTATILICREVGASVYQALVDTGRKLALLADRHRGAVMAARTHSQQALPFTFGLKAAHWLGPLKIGRAHV